MTTKGVRKSKCGRHWLRGEFDAIIWVNEVDHRLLWAPKDVIAYAIESYDHTTDPLCLRQKRYKDGMDIWQVPIPPDNTFCFVRCQFVVDSFPADFCDVTDRLIILELVNSIYAPDFRCANAIPFLGNCEWAWDEADPEDIAKRPYVESRRVSLPRVRRKP